MFVENQCPRDAGKHQERKAKTMAQHKIGEATQNFTRSVRETNQAFVESAVAAQERNMRYAQSTFENGIEVLKGHAEDTRTLLQTVVEQPQKPQDAIQAVVDTAVAAQERNMRYAQSLLQNGIGS